jgi:hypothetical protein
MSRMLSVALGIAQQRAAPKWDGMTGFLRPKLDSTIPAIFILSLTVLLPGNIANSDPRPAPDGARVVPAAPQRIVGPAPERAAVPPRASVVAPAAERVSAQGGAVTPSVAAPAQEAAAPAAQNCDTGNADAGNTIVYSLDEPQESSCPGIADGSIAADRAYLVETATPGYTMTRQGPDVAIGRLNPEFVHRLAGAIREAREAGLSSVGIFSAYRPPAFGVGGFSDKFNSLHTYGLAVDMTGIGGPGSPEAKTWREIAGRHDIICPYSVDSHTEWNHCQPTKVKIIVAENPLRETVTADGPVDLESMFEAGTALIERSANEPDSERAEMAHVEIVRRNVHAAGAPNTSHAGRANHFANHQGKAVRLAAHQIEAKTLLARHKLKGHQPQNEKA